MNLRNAVVLVAALVGLGGCNGGSSGGGGAPMTDELLMEALVSSNVRHETGHYLQPQSLHYDCYLGRRYQAIYEEGGRFVAYLDREAPLSDGSYRQLGPDEQIECLSWRWPDGLIPVKGVDIELASRAMDEIERVFNRRVFDRESLRDVADADVTAGIIVSTGTAYLPEGGDPQSYCGNVATGKYRGDPINNYVMHEGAEPALAAPVFVNLGNHACTPSLRIAIHEFGHAMGLMGHFQNFGHGGAIGPEFWIVLFSLYENPVGTREADLLLHRPQGY